LHERITAMHTTRSCTFSESTIDRWEQLAILAGQPTRQATNALLAALADDDPFIRWEAGVALAQTARVVETHTRRPRVRRAGQVSEISFSYLWEQLGRLLCSDSEALRASAADALGHCEHHNAVSMLVPALKDPAQAVRSSAANSLGALADRGAQGPLIAALEDDDLWTQRVVVQALGAIAADKAVPRLERLLDGAPLVLGEAIVCALGHMASPRSRRLLTRLTEDENLSIRWHAARGLTEVGTVAAVPALRQMLGDRSLLFGETIDAVALRGIEAINSRHRGLWNRLRRGVHTVFHCAGRLRHVLASRRQASEDAGRTGDEPVGLEPDGISVPGTTHVE